MDPDELKVTEHLSPSNRHKLMTVLQEYENCFADSDSDLGETHMVQMRIDTGSHAPIKQKPYRTPFPLRSMVESHVKEMLSAGVKRPSVSP